MIFADTGYFIALLNPRDEIHARAVAWSLALSEQLVDVERFAESFAV